MITTTHTSIPLTAARGRRRVGAALAVFSLVLLTCGTAAAQDNDDDGVLPYHGGKSSEGTIGGGGGGGGSSSSSSASVGTTIGIAGPLQDGVIDARQAHLELSTAAGGTDLVVDDELEDATFTGDGDGLNLDAQDDAVRLQGAGELVLQPGLEATFHAADDAIARQVLLVLDDGSASLADVLAGETQPGLIIPLGDLTEADLVVMQAVLDHRAADMPGVHATLVFGSVDTGGGLHLDAVRASTDSDPLEFASR